MTDSARERYRPAALPLEEGNNAWDQPSCLAGEAAEPAALAIGVDDRPDDGRSALRLSGDRSA